MERHSHLNHQTIDAIITVYRDVHLSRQYVQMTNTVVICTAAYENTLLSVLSRRLVKTRRTSLAVTCSTVTTVTRHPSATNSATWHSSFNHHQRRSHPRTVRRPRPSTRDAPTSSNQRYGSSNHRHVPGRLRSIAWHHKILAHRHATIATWPTVTVPSSARWSHHITPRHRSTDVNHRSDGATRRAPRQTPGAAPTARNATLRRATGDVQFINGLHPLSNDWVDEFFCFMKKIISFDFWYFQFNLSLLVKFIVLLFSFRVLLYSNFFSGRSVTCIHILHATQVCPNATHTTQHLIITE